MNICYKIFGKYAFRRLNTEQRRGPVNKFLFEAWSLIICNLNDDDTNVLIDNKDNLCTQFTRLCENDYFKIVIRSSDKNSVKTRITMIQNMVNDFIGGRVSD